jgi:serine/threonine-protein kinase
VRQRAAIAPFSTVELLGAAAFTGFEGGLLAIALLSLSGTVLIGAGFWVVLLVGLVFLQNRRIIERLDLLIVVGLTLPIVLFLPPLHGAVARLGNNVLTTVIAIAVVTGLSAIAVTALFRIIFNLLSNWL